MLMLVLQIPSSMDASRQDEEVKVALEAPAVSTAWPATRLRHLRQAQVSSDVACGRVDQVSSDAAWGVESKLVPTLLAGGWAR